MRPQKRKSKPGKMDKLRYEVEDAKHMQRVAYVDMYSLLHMFKQLSAVVALSPEMSSMIADIKSRHNILD